jgi:hypothetical protein
LSSPETYLCCCGGLLKLDHVDDIGTEFFKCSGCERIVCRAELEKNRNDSLESLSQLKLSNDEIEREATLEEIVEILNSTIKFDNDIKILVFLCCLTAFTEKDQVNILMLGESSTGKTYNVSEVLQFFDSETIIKKHSVSKMAFWYDENNEVVDKETLEPIVLIKPRKEKEETDEHYHERLNKYWELKKNCVLLQDFERKIVFLPDMPSLDVLQTLQPLLSHDDKIIKKLSTTLAKYGHMAREFWIKGFGVFIIASASAFVSQENATRTFPLNPEWTEEKGKACIELINKRRGSPEFEKTLEADPKRIWLKERVRRIKEAHINEIYIPEMLSEDLEKWYRDKRKISTPKDSREYIRVGSLAIAWALFNLWNRKRDEKNNLYCNEKDIEVAKKVYNFIVESSAYNLTKEEYSFYLHLKELSKDLSLEITVQDALNFYFQKIGRPCDDMRMRNWLHGYCREGIMFSEKHGKNKYVYFIQTNKPKVEGNQIKNREEEVKKALMLPNTELGLVELLKIPQEEVHNIILKLQTNGMISEPQTGYYQLIKR